MKNEAEDGTFNRDPFWNSLVEFIAPLLSRQFAI